MGVIPADGRGASRAMKSRTSVDSMITAIGGKQRQARRKIATMTVLPDWSFARELAHMTPTTFCRRGVPGIAPFVISVVK